VSIETALIFGETDRFYSVLDSEQQGSDGFFDSHKYEEHETLGLHVVNIDYDNEKCSMILFRNWTSHFKH
jgi:hypothetical protein